MLKTVVSNGIYNMIIHYCRLFILLDRHTLYLLANNQRICDFVPELKEIFSQIVVSSVQVRLHTLCVASQTVTLLFKYTDCCVS